MPTYCKFNSSKKNRSVLNKQCLTESIVGNVVILHISNTQSPGCLPLLLSLSNSGYFISYSFLFLTVQMYFFYFWHSMVGPCLKFFFKNIYFEFMEAFHTQIVGENGFSKQTLLGLFHVLSTTRNVSFSWLYIIFRGCLFCIQNS